MTAHQRLYDMILSRGTEEVYGNNFNPDRVKGKHIDALASDGKREAVSKGTPGISRRAVQDKISAIGATSPTTAKSTGKGGSGSISLDVPVANPEHKIKRKKPPRSNFAIARMPFCGTEQSPDADASMEF